MTQYTKLFASRNDQVARTPSYLIRLARDTFVPGTPNFFDPCPPDWTPESEWDALDENQAWGEYNFVNPPFDKTAKFFDRAVAQQDHAVSVFLVPCRFHTRFFARALPHIRRIGLINERVKFVGYKTPLQAAMCFVVFGPEHKLAPPTREDRLNFGFYVDNLSPTVADVIPDADTHLLKGAVSKPLQEILDRDERAVVLSPARLDNKVLLRAVTAPSTYSLFLCPTLKDNETKTKYLEGSMLLSIQGAGTFPHLERNSQLWGASTRLGWIWKPSSHVLTPAPAGCHEEREYTNLLSLTA